MTVAFAPSSQQKQVEAWLWSISVPAKVGDCCRARLCQLRAQRALLNSQPGTSQCTPQDEASDLGQRMRAALEQALSAGAGKVYGSTELKAHWELHKA